MIKEHKVLEKIWLSQTEAELYLVVLKSWILSITGMAQITRINRPRIYATLPNLLSLGLLSQVIRGKRKLYSAESPDTLENLFERTKNDFSLALWALQHVYQKEKNKPLMRSIEWENFNKFIYEDVVNTLDVWDTYMRYSSRTSEQWVEKYAHYRKIRDAKDIQRLIITSEDNAQKKPKRLSHEVLTIPKKYDLFDDNISKVIYKNKVAIIDYNTMTSFVIEDLKFAKFEAKLFKLLFKFLKGR